MRSALNKDIIKCEVLKIKHELFNDLNLNQSSKQSVNLYLNKVLNKIEEYRY